MNPERSAIHNLDSRTRAGEIKESADKLLRSSEKVREALEAIAFDPRTFTDLYSIDAIERDLRYVADRNRMFLSSANIETHQGLSLGNIKALSERVEYEIIRGINIGQWFEGVTAYKTSEYDDIAGGVDAIFEIEDDQKYGHLGLGIDITFSQDIEKKFSRIKAEIDDYDGEQNRLARVKYFRSQNTGIPEELTDLTRAVIAVDLPMLQDMTGAKDASSLNSHISKHITLLEIQHQLDIFLRYAERHNPRAVRPMERATSFIGTLVQSLGSENRVSKSEYIKNRKADNAIARGLQLFH